MSEEIFPYDQWVNEALRSVLSRALKQLSERGPVGDHHFFINFDTSHEGVDIPGFLRAQYPEEITIVLQHQFDDLVIEDHGFEVSLSFSGKKSLLKVPFDAVTSFADPSVNFGLQIGINAVSDTMTQMQSELEPSVTETVEPQEQGEAVEPTPFVPAQAQAQKEEVFDEEASEPALNEATENESQTAEVIALDAFRKK
jgi:uncharacterized protein